MLSLLPTDDTYIRPSFPDTPAGWAPELVTDDSPVTDFLIRFNVTGTGGCTVSDAKLRLTVGPNAYDRSEHGGDFHGVGTDWTESTATWNNAPAAGPTVATLGPVALNSTYMVDVSPLVTGDGPVAIRVSSTSADAAKYLSKEGSATEGPRLQVTCS